MISLIKRKRFHWLAEVINKQEFRIGAEVGTATGVTTKHLMENCPSLELLYVADDWRAIPEAGNMQWKRNDMEHIFHRNLEQYKQRLKILKGLSWEQAKHIPNDSLDFVFIDADHDYKSVSLDLQAWISKVNANGIVSGHDLHFEGVVKALNEFAPMYRRAGVDNVWWFWMHEYVVYCNHG